MTDYAGVKGVCAYVVPDGDWFVDGEGCIALPSVPPCLIIEWLLRNDKQKQNNKKEKEKKSIFQQPQW